MPTRILLADDHEIVRQGLRLLLQREGLEVIGEAANGQEAIRLASETCPDVAVLDYGMPLLNGIGAAREIMQVSKTTKEVAKLLGSSAKTVESHRTRIMKKLDTPNTAGIVRYAIRLGLIQV